MTSNPGSIWGSHGVSEEGPTSPMSFGEIFAAHRLPKCFEKQEICPASCFGVFFGHVTWHMGSSPTRNQIHAPSTRSSESNHWTLAKSPVKLLDCPCFLGAQAQRGPDPDILAVPIFPRGTHVPWAQPSQGAQHCPEPTAAPAGGREWVSTQV